MLMADVMIDLLKAHFRQLRLPTMGREFEKAARRCRVQSDLHRVLAPVDRGRTGDPCRQRIATRIKNAEFPVLKDFDTYDFSALPQLSKPKILELSRCDRVEHKSNCCP